MNSLNDFNSNLTSLVVGVALGAIGMHYHYVAKEAKLLDTVAKQHVIDSRIIADYQTNQMTLQQSYIELGKKLHDKTLTTTPCTLTVDGVGMWNQSSSPAKGLPTGSSGASSGTTTSGVTFEQALANKLENDKACNQMREELVSIKQWRKDTYGE
jgi:hypothetical protein